MADLGYAKGGFYLSYAHLRIDHAYNVLLLKTRSFWSIVSEVSQSISIRSVLLVGELKPESFCSYIEGREGSIPWYGIAAVYFGFSQKGGFCRNLRTPLNLPLGTYSKLAI